MSPVIQSASVLGLHAAFQNPSTALLTGQCAAHATAKPGFRLLKGLCHVIHVTDAVSVHLALTLATARQEDTVFFFQPAKSKEPLVL